MVGIRVKPAAKSRPNMFVPVIDLLMRMLLLSQLAHMQQEVIAEGQYFGVTLLMERLCLSFLASLFIWLSTTFHILGLC
jgi:hypothetical protein